MKYRQWAGRRKTILLALFSFAAVAGILGILVYRQWDAFATFQWQLNWGAVLVSFGLLLVGLVLAAGMWSNMMRVLGSQLPAMLHIRYYVISHLARRLPGTVWYIAGRGYLYHQHGEPVRLVTIASGLEYVLLTLAGALVSLAIWAGILRNLSLTNYGALGITVILGALAVHPASIRWYLRRTGLADAPALAYHHILFWLAIGAVIWLLGGGMFYALAYAIAGVAPAYLMYVIGSWCLVGTLSVVVFFLPSNFGFTELGMSLLLSAIMPSSLAVVVAVLSRVFFIAFDLIAAGLFFGTSSLVRRLRRSHPRQAPARGPQTPDIGSAPEVEDKIPPTAY